MPRKTATSPASISTSSAPVVFLHPGTLSEPSRELGKSGREMWDRLNAAYQIDDAVAVEQILLACEAVDIAESTDDARAALAAKNFTAKILKNFFAAPKRDRPGHPPGRGNPW